MLDELFRGLVIVPFYGVPIALVAWTIVQFAVQGARVKALVGLAAGTALSVGAFLLFFSNIYCESCAGRPVTLHEAVAVLAYLGFGLVMLLVLWWTAGDRKKRSPSQAED